MTDAISRSAILEEINEMDISDCTDVDDVISKAYATIAYAPTLSLNTLRDAIYEDAVSHGLWDDMDDLVCAQAYVVVSEVRELIDAAADLSLARDRGDDLEKYKRHFAEELADVVISSLSLAGKQKVDIDAAVRGKMEINKTRPWRHDEK